MRIFRSAHCGMLSMIVLCFSSSLVSGQGFAVGGYEVISSNRVGRTTWEYSLRVLATNNFPSAQGVLGSATSTVANTTTILQGTVGFGDIASGAFAVSTNLIRIRQDRLASFNPASLQWSFTVRSMPLLLTIESPLENLSTNGNHVLVSGRIGLGVANVEVNGIIANVAGDHFSAEVPIREGRNAIVAIARNAVGGTGSATLSVHRDTTAPLLNIEQPSDGTVVFMSQITVVGMVNDVVSGTVNIEQCHVSVNGVEANVANRSYEARDIGLSLGTNVLMVSARDRAGNTTMRQVRVTFREPAAQQRIIMVSGNNQSAVIGTVLREPLTVAILDSIGNPLTNQPVSFRVVRNDGILKAPPLEGREIVVRTDDNGLATAFFQLGTRTGAGNNQVAVTSTGFAEEIVFCSSAVGGDVNRISALLPETQVGETGKTLTQPWTAYVTDTGGNPVSSIPVTFMVFQGDGDVDGATMVTKNTDGDGRASVSHTLGLHEGINNNVVLAMIAGLTNSAATFTASARQALAAENTRVVGLVLNNANQPMSNILCQVAGTSLQTLTDSQGQFVISNAPLGTIHLFVDARDRGYPGTWHALEFVIDVVTGRDNSVDRPIYMLPLGDSALAGGEQTVTLQMRDMPGASMTILPRSLRDADGRPVITNVSFTQVNMERVPMPPPLGSQFMLAWTVQPAGLHFDPPAQMCIPNMGAPAGQVVEMFSFDHDLIQFVAIGTATVTADGALMCSDPGFGVTKSGWGGCVPPPPPKKCVPPDCDDGNPCTTDRCVNGVCFHDPPTPPMACCEYVGFLGFRQRVIYNTTTHCCAPTGVVPKTPISDLEDCPGRVPNLAWTFVFDGCSLPFSPGFDKDNPAGGADTRFSNAALTGPCDNHDRCYQTCNPAPGARAACDLGMYNDMRAVCLASTAPAAVRTSCLTWADRYYSGLRNFGGSAFEGRQKQVCQCCP